MFHRCSIIPDMGAVVAGAARLEVEMTQEDVAKNLRVDQSWVSKVERGVRRLDVI